MIFLMSCVYFHLNAQNKMGINQALTIKQQQIVTISAFTAKGNQQSLSTAVNDGLDAGLTINEVKEIMVQLYAYAGFPRSLNALNTLMAVLKEREQRGIKDEVGRRRTKTLPQGSGTVAWTLVSRQILFRKETSRRLSGGSLRG